MSKRGSLVLGAVAAIAAALGLAGPLLAQEGPPPGGEKAAEAAPSTGTCTFDVRDQSIDRVLDYVRRAAGTGVVIMVAPEAMNERVTMKAPHMTWRSALDEIARYTGCTIEEYPDMLRVEKPPRVTFSFEQAEISKVIRTIAAISGANIVADPEDVKGLVTVNLIDVPWKRALTSIVGTKGYQLVEEPGGIIRVVSRGKLELELETRIYQLKYLRPPPDYSPKMASSEYAERTGTKAGGDLEKSFTIITSLRKALAPEGDLQYINNQNALVLKGTKPKLASVEKMLQALDREPLQIFVDMQFVATSNQDLFNIGAGFGPNGVGGSAGFAKISGAVRLPFNVDNGGWEDWLLVNDSQPRAADMETPNAGYGTLDFSNMSYLLMMMKNDTKSRVVQAPKLYVLDNQEATIFVGETIRFAQTEASSSQSGTLAFSIKEASTSPVSKGFQLLVVPHVIPDTDKVIMMIIPTRTDLTGTSAELPGFDKFTVGSGSTGDQTIFLPRQSSSTLVTTLICQHGVTTVLGGMMSDQATETVNKLPWLGDIPFLGYLFKTQQRGHQTSQLYIFVTPYLVKEPSLQRESLKKDLLRRAPGLDVEWQKILDNTPEGMPTAEPPEEPPKEAPAAAPKTAPAAKEAPKEPAKKTDAPPPPEKKPAGPK